MLKAAEAIGVVLGINDKGSVIGWTFLQEIPQEVITMQNRWTWYPDQGAKPTRLRLKVNGECDRLLRVLQAREKETARCSEEVTEYVLLVQCHSRRNQQISCAGANYAKQMSKP